MYYTRSHNKIRSERGEGVTIRLARSEDRAALVHLAQLDSAPAPPLGEMLVGEFDGRLSAAVSVAGDYAIADPFKRTLEILDLLKTRARQLHSESEPHKRSRRTLVRWRRRLARQS